jgi:hypothetical protein
VSYEDRYHLVLFCVYFVYGVLESVLRVCCLFCFWMVRKMEPAVAILSSYEENAKWLSRNYDELKKKFNNEWVAVLRKTVIDHDGDLTKLVKRLRQQHSKVYNQIAVEYVTTKELDLIL